MRESYSSMSLWSSSCYTAWQLWYRIQCWSPQTSGIQFAEWLLIFGLPAATLLPEWCYCVSTLPQLLQIGHFCLADVSCVIWHLSWWGALGMEIEAEIALQIVIQAALVVMIVVVASCKILKFPAWHRQCFPLCNSTSSKAPHGRAVTILYDLQIRTYFSLSFPFLPWWG